MQDGLCISGANHLSGLNGNPCSGYERIWSRFQWFDRAGRPSLVREARKKKWNGMSPRQILQLVVSFIQESQNGSMQFSFPLEPRIGLAAKNRFWSGPVDYLAVVIKTVLGSHFGGFSVNSPPILGPICWIGMFTGGYDLGFDPWPFKAFSARRSMVSLWLCPPWAQPPWRHGSGCTPRKLSAKMSKVAAQQAFRNALNAYGAQAW